MEKAFESENYVLARKLIKENKHATLTVKPQYDTYTQDTVIRTLTDLKTLFKYCDRMKYDVIKVF